MSRHLNQKQEERSIPFRDREGNRYWWHRFVGRAYIPPVFSFLDDCEWEIMREWFEETEKKRYIGECAVPFISMVQGIIMGNALQKIVQLGTYAGYSALLIGFMARRMQVEHALYSIDIHAETTDFARKYLGLADLEKCVHLEVSDSADPSLTGKARRYLGGDPEMIVVDSSHRYEHTLMELDLWFPCLAPTGIILMHDSSAFAQQFDASGKGGVKRALREWALEHESEVSCINLGSSKPDLLKAYKDGCGIAIIQKNENAARPADSILPGGAV